MKIGLVGFAGCGKTTVFNALTGLGIDLHGGKEKTHLGVVKVPDERLERLATIYKPKKTTYAEVTFGDVGKAGSPQGIDRATLNAMREVDALVQVIGGFPATDLPAPISQIETMQAELILSDLEVVEKRVAKVAKERKDPRELALLERLQQELEAERPLRNVELSDDEKRIIAGYRFLSQKPIILVLNVGEDEVADDVPAEVVALAKQLDTTVLALSAQLEMEISQLEPAEQKEFLESVGLSAPASARFIRTAFDLLELISMLTAGEDECRAWPIRAGSPAPKAAGKIHSDIERGFIRAEVIAFADLMEYGSESKCRDAGKLRIEGKNYVVQDGDIINFRFNV